MLLMKQKYVNSKIKHRSKIDWKIPPSPPKKKPTNLNWKKTQHDFYSFIFQLVKFSKPRTEMNNSSTKS